MAANIKKPNDWKGRIILFGCSTGDIASQVAKEYYKRTKKSVTVVGTKEDISVLTSPFDRDHSFFGFTDPQKEANLKSDLDFQLLNTLDYIISKLHKGLEFLANTLTNPSLKPNQKTQQILLVINMRIDPAINETSRKIRTSPARFCDRYPNLRTNLQFLYNKSRLIEQASLSLAFSKNISLSEWDDKMIKSKTDQLHKLVNQAMVIHNKMSSYLCQKYISVFKSGLDFDDKEMMISAPYTDEDEWAERALVELMDWFGDNTKENPKKPSDTK